MFPCRSCAPPRRLFASLSELRSSSPLVCLPVGRSALRASVSLGAPQGALKGPVDLSKGRTPASQRAGFSAFPVGAALLLAALFASRSRFDRSAPLVCVPVATPPSLSPPGFVPVVHSTGPSANRAATAWMPGTGTGMTGWAVLEVPQSLFSSCPDLIGASSNHWSLRVSTPTGVTGSSGQAGR